IFINAVTHNNYENQDFLIKTLPTLSNNRSTQNSIKKFLSNKYANYNLNYSPYNYPKNYPNKLEREILLLLNKYGLYNDIGIMAQHQMTLLTKTQKSDYEYHELSSDRVRMYNKLTEINNLFKDINSGSFAPDLQQKIFIKNNLPQQSCLMDRLNEIEAQAEYLRLAGRYTTEYSNIHNKISILEAPTTPIRTQLTGDYIIPESIKMAIDLFINNLNNATNSNKSRIQQQYKYFIGILSKEQKKIFYDTQSELLDHFIIGGKIKSASTLVKLDKELLDQNYFNDLLVEQLVRRNINSIGWENNITGALHILQFMEQHNLQAVLDNEKILNHNNVRGSIHKPNPQEVFLKTNQLNNILDIAKMSTGPGIDKLTRMIKETISSLTPEVTVVSPKKWLDPKQCQTATPIRI
ncbi:MAG: hypothetical protein AAF195_02675, partial [Pseudomonadota bacterium]